MGSNNENKKTEFLKNLFSVLKNKIHKVDQSSTLQNRELIESINNAKDEWIAAQKNFQFVDTDDGVDYYAYKIKAYEVKYQALLKEAKNRGVKITENRSNLF